MDLLALPTAELKRRLATGKDFAAIMKYFFDRFVDEPKFMEASVPAKVPKNLSEAVGTILKHVRPSAAIVSTWEIGEVSLLNLIHGTITVDSGPAVIVWATDIETGLLGLPDMKTGKVMYARITVSKPSVAGAH